LISKNELQELVDEPNETLETEYKTWLDLNDGVTRAHLAQHLAALANHGGGRIVIGFSDDMRPDEVNPFKEIVYDRDLISSVVKKYLEPTFQCDVSWIRSALGKDHPVITVPAHGASPICSKADGPQDARGKVQGISRATYYIRKPGPESAPITTSIEWAPLIRRCAMHERSSILSAIDVALRGAIAHPQLSAEDSLKRWHDAAHDAYLKDALLHKKPDNLSKCHWQFSYFIERSDGQKIDSNKLIEIVRQVNGEVHDLVISGWSMFYAFTKKGIYPSFITDPNSGQDDNDFLECSLLRDPDPIVSAFDMWRVSPDGYATIIRNYWEDSGDSNQRPSGTWFSPKLLARSLAELVRHARGMAERFESATSITIRCEWHGLSGRVIWDPWGVWFPNDNPARSEERVSGGSWPITTLESGLPEIVAQLAAPVMRAFPANSFVMTVDWIRGQTTWWRR